MSGERGETVDLAYIGRALQRLTTEVASLRDDMGVLTAIVLRHEETLLRMLEQITAMVAQNCRIVDRLGVVEGRLTALESQPVAFRVEGNYRGNMQTINPATGREEQPAIAISRTTRELGASAKNSLMSN